MRWVEAVKEIGFSAQDALHAIDRLKSNILRPGAHFTGGQLDLQPLPVEAYSSNSSVCPRGGATTRRVPSARRFNAWSATRRTSSG